MAPILDHHHRSTTKASHKPFKSKHSTKGLLKERSKGKVEEGEKRLRKSPHQQLMSKLDRRNQARQKLQTKHQENVKATNIFSGHH
ncbi:MAG: ribosome biogenesis protein tsr1, partial [Pleopsidium flavum]